MNPGAATEVVIRPTLRGWLAHFGEGLLVLGAIVAPMHAVSALGWLDTPQPERSLYWKLFAIAAWYTTIALLVAIRLLYRAWQIHRSGCWPDPGAFVAFATVVRRDWRVRMQSAGALLLAIMVLATLAMGWRAFGVPGIFLDGYGDGVIGGTRDCPPDVDASAAVNDINSSGQ